MKSIKKTFFLSLSFIISIFFVSNSTLYSAGKIIILDGMSTVGKTSICRNLKNCEYLSYDKTACNLFAEVVEKKIPTLKKEIIEKLVKHNIVSVEKGENNAASYRFPRNSMKLLFEKAVLFAKYIPSTEVILGYYRTESDRKELLRHKEEQNSSKKGPVVLLTPEDKKNCVAKIGSTMFQEAVRLAESGKNVVIDTVIEESSIMETFKQFFKKYNPLFVLVHCSPKVIVERVRARNLNAEKNGTSIFEARKLDQPLEQLLSMYKFGEGFSKVSPSDSQNFILSENDLEFIFKSGKNLFDEGCDVKVLKGKMLQEFSLQSNKFVRVEPRFAHDLIIDNGEKKGSLESCVQKIQALLD
jgi:chloramphenicol 3-O-phosphotransferase